MTRNPILAVFLAFACLSLVAAPASAEDEIEVTAIKVAADYAKDSAAADALYKGKWLLVTGVIEDGGVVEATGENFLTLATEETILVVQCIGVGGADVKKGSTVTVRGRCDGGVGSVLLRECTMAE